MDKYYGNVCELDIIFNFQKAYFILDELLLAGEMQESSKKNVLRCISQQDSLEDMEVSNSQRCNMGAICRDMQYRYHSNTNVYIFIRPRMTSSQRSCKYVQEASTTYTTPRRAWRRKRPTGEVEITVKPIANPWVRLGFRLTVLIRPWQIVDRSRGGHLCSLSAGQ